MKLGTQTASVTNHLYSRMTKGAPAPEVGMGVTILHWTDRSAGTITEVRKAGKAKPRTLLVITSDFATRTDDNGMSESQEYEYTRNPNGVSYTFRETESGGWEEVRWSAKANRWVKCEGGGHGLRVGERRAYHDFSF